MPKFVTMGELLVDFISYATGRSRWLAPVGREKPAQEGDIPSFIPAPGGAPANVAAGLSRLGKDVGFIGKVGDDPFGGRWPRRSRRWASIRAVSPIPIGRARCLPLLPARRAASGILSSSATRRPTC